MLRAIRTSSPMQKIYIYPELTQAISYIKIYDIDL
jgi:hypothetical protein